jgi:phospholipid/cholesterol/gamma-HCH transport system substrate-binding protein
MTELSEQYIVVGQRVSDMLEPRPPEAVDRGEVQANMRTAIARADARLAEMRQTIEQVNALVSNEQFRENVFAAAENARGVTADAKALTGDARKQLDRLVSRYIAVADDLSGTVDRVDSLLAETQAGEGTVGRLMKDPALYNSVTDAANRLSDLVEETQLLIEKWRAEGVPVRF